MLEDDLSRSRDDEPSQPEHGELILIVEDDEDMQDVLQHVLQEEGYRTCAARNGDEALRALAAIGRPMLIMTDLRMPVMSGWELIDRLRGDETLSEIPVVAVTAELPSRRRELEVPVFQKPLSLDTLLDLVKQHAA